MRELIAQRRASYEEADFTVSTDDLTVAQVADRVVALLGSREGRRR